MRIPFDAPAANGSLADPVETLPLNGVTAPDSLDTVDRVDTGAGTGAHQRALGELLRETRTISDDQIDQILRHQRAKRLPFGEAAVALNLATQDEVLRALSRQFHYDYAGAAPRQYEELVVASQPFGDQAESFRELRTQLAMGILAPEEPRRALAVVSPDTGDGKTFVAANLAVAFSQLGGHTLLIDVDMRTPRLHRLFGMDTRSGLSNILSGRSEANVIRPVPELPSLYLLPAGSVPPNPLELVQRAAFGILVHELLAKFDYVVVDTPATTHGADGRVIAARCGAALAIGRRGRSRIKAMQQLVGTLGQGPAKLAGVVMNER